jgi:hypothetical protein
MLAEAVDHLIEATNRIIRLRRACESMSADTGAGATYAQIENELGLTPGTGQALLTALTDIEGRLTTSFVYAFRDRLDQG